jgi:phage shock protein PspC (stress-responsive transcriptional regulator)
MAELKRPTSGRVIAGVCAGIAERFGWSPGLVRLAFVLSCLLPGPQFLIYIALWIIVPSAGARPISR